MEKNLGRAGMRRGGYTTRALGMTMALLAAPAMFGATLLSENFESPAGLADGNWAVFGSAQIVTDPQNALNKAVRFNNTGFGGDLFSVFINYASAPQYDGRLFLSFDFLHTGGSLHAYVGTDHQQSCCGPEQWLWSDDGASPYSTAVPVNTWTHVSFVFPPFDPGATGSIVLKMEAVAGVDFFDNFSLQTAPEPATFGLAAACILALTVLLWRKAHDSRDSQDTDSSNDFDSLE